MINRRPHFPLIFTLAIVAYGAPRALAQAPIESRQLTLSQAIGLAIQNNLTTQVAAAQTEQARGQAIQSAAALLPHLLGTASQSRTFKVNLEAQGFPANSFFNPLIGPFNTFDARLRFSQSLFDLNAIWNHQAGRAHLEAAKWQEKSAREQVSTAAALAYLEDLQTARSVSAAQANFDLSQSLLNLARNQHKAGIATGVDLARAETRAAEDNVRLIRSRVASTEAALHFKRVVGLPLSEPVTLVDTLRATPLTLPDEEAAAQQAFAQRFELLFFRERMHADQLSLRAARSGRLPVITANADYGFSGNLPDRTARTGSIGGQLNLPIFYGGQIHGQVKEAQGRASESEARFRDAKRQVEVDVRLAVQTLSAEVEEVRTAYSVVELAERELKLAKDRYGAGLGDNIQLTTAQTSLADARYELVESLARYNTARINLATALGETEKFQL